MQRTTFEGTANGVAVRSYCKVVQGLASTNTGTPSAMGRWLIKEKRIYRCNDETPPPWRARRYSRAQAVATRRGACGANDGERLRPVFYLLDEGEDVGDALVGI
jgi:hypothetical protein